MTKRLPRKLKKKISHTKLYSIESYYSWMNMSPVYIVNVDSALDRIRKDIKDKSFKSFRFYTEMEKINNF